jgi:hypothetical protein
MSTQKSLNLLSSIYLQAIRGRLVDLGLGEVLDDATTIKEATKGRDGTAKSVGTLLDVVVALKLGLSDAAQPSAAVVSAGNAAALLARGARAGVLLEAGVGDAALAVGHGAVLVLALDEDGVAGGAAHTLDVDEAGRGNGGEEENRGDVGELHLGGLGCFCLSW